MHKATIKADGDDGDSPGSLFGDVPDLDRKAAEIGKDRESGNPLHGEMQQNMIVTCQSTEAQKTKRLTNKFRRKHFRKLIYTHFLEHRKV